MKNNEQYNNVLYFALIIGLDLIYILLIFPFTDYYILWLLEFNILFYSDEGALKWAKQLSLDYDYLFCFQSVC